MQDFFVIGGTALSLDTGLSVADVLYLRRVMGGAREAAPPQ